MDDPKKIGSGMMCGHKGQGSMMMHGEMMSGMGSIMNDTTDLMQRLGVSQRRACRVLGQVTQILQ